MTTNEPREWWVISYFHKDDGIVRGAIFRSEEQAEKFGQQLLYTVLDKPYLVREVIE